MDSSELAYVGCVVAFDLDDTLFSELDFLKSGYRAVAAFVQPLLADSSLRTGDDIYSAMLSAYKSGVNAFSLLAGQATVDSSEFINRCVETYRYHTPQIAPYDGVIDMLGQLSGKGIRLAIITDGRSRTQRNKIAALGLERFFPPENILISEEIGEEKTGIAPWQYLVHRYPNASRFVYVGDNPAKDFIMPRSLGWLTIGLRDSGSNIHQQTESLSARHEPALWADNIASLSRILTENI